MAELFDNFEVNRDPKWPIISRLVGASALLHLALLWLVIYVPAVRDTVNIAALIASTRFVDEDYVATQIGDDVQIVELEKFRYPDGYFAMDAQAGSGLVAAANDPFAPKPIAVAQCGSKPGPEPGSVAESVRICIRVAADRAECKPDSESVTAKQGRCAKRAGKNSRAERRPAA
jgi:hypothetical protein